MDGLCELLLVWDQGEKARRVQKRLLYSFSPLKKKKKNPIKKLIRVLHGVGDCLEKAGFWFPRKKFCLCEIAVTWRKINYQNDYQKLQKQSPFGRLLSGDLLYFSCILSWVKKNYVSLDHCFLFSRNRADGTKRTKNWAFFSFEVIVNMFSLISEQFSRSVPPKNRKLEGLLSLLAFTLNNFLIIASATVLAALIIAKVNFSRYEPFCKTIVKLSEI